VQRGLVKLRSLAVLFVLCAAVQLALSAWHSPRLVLLLLLTWAYLALMCKQSFVAEWLRARPIVYLWSHMLIMPLVDLFATECDWTVSVGGKTGAPGSLAGLSLFLAASFFNGIVIELGRKIRSPVDEERGVRTYTVLWGPRRAVTAWLGDGKTWEENWFIDWARGVNQLIFASQPPGG
jgi:hypothetical protein